VTALEYAASKLLRAALAIFVCVRAIAAAPTRRAAVEPSNSTMTRTWPVGAAAAVAAPGESVSAADAIAMDAIAGRPRREK